jgi:hypothetical protein
MVKNVMTGLPRLTLLFALLSLPVVPTLATASTVTLTDYNLGNPHFLNNAAGGGGPFEAKTTAGTVLGVADFVTFCIEYNEHFSYGGTYDFTLSDSAVSGGVAGGNPDPLSDTTKWLYYEVVSGGYTSMYSAATGLGLTNDVGANFQYAFWYLEQERTEAEIGSSSAGFKLATYALANQNWSNLFAAGNRVYAMNLTDAAGGLHQDQLAYTFVNTTQQVPVPEPASLTLLGTGLLLACRKLRKGRGHTADSLQ